MKIASYHLLTLLSILLLLQATIFAAPNKESAVLDDFHVIAIKGATHNIQVGKPLQLSAVSNKGHESFTWSAEDEPVARVTQAGLVNGIKKGTTLIIANSTKDQCKGIYMLVVADPSKAEKNTGIPFRNKGILLFPADVDSVPEWPRLAKEAGLNTIGIHPGGGHLRGIVEDLERWIQGAKGQKFLANCKKHGIEVEYEIHAVEELLPRKLFLKDPSMFRSAGGKRHQQYNFCVHSYDALKELGKNVLRLSRHAKPTTGRYYYWPDDGRGMCGCFACKEYSDSEQFLMMELYLQKELSKIDSKATVSHLCYAKSMVPPSKIKPNDKIFLEYAPMARSYDKPYSVQKDSKEGWANLEANLKVFPADTAQVLEYWVDVSKWSNWKRPFKPLPWDGKLRDVVGKDVEFYRSLGIESFTSFGNGLDAYYKENYGFGDVINEYGNALSQVDAVDEGSGETVYHIESGGEHSIVVDGVIGADEWPVDGWNANFVFPWQRKRAPRTEMNCVIDGGKFYATFRCDDDDIVIRGGVPRVETDIAKGDRVELFFARDLELKEYYCLEISPAGDVLDYKASHYRKFDDSWNCLGLEVAAKTSGSGYVVELMIPISTLRELTGSNWDNDAAIPVGAFRGEFSHTKDGNSKDEWISWIRPDAEEPDFHIPSSLGTFKPTGVGEK